LFLPITCHTQKEDQLSPDNDKRLETHNADSASIDPKWQKIGTMHINEFPPITHTSNFMCLKCSFSEKSVQHEMQGDKKYDIPVDNMQVMWQRKLIFVIR
jgi:NAD-dependent DNA ligase